MRNCGLRLFWFVLVLSLLWTSPSTRAAVALPDTVRILLLAASAKTTTATITQSTDFSCESSAKVFLSLRDEQGVFRLIQGGYWQLGGSYTSYEEAKRQGQSKIGNTLPWLPAYDGSWRIWAGNPEGPSLSEPDVKIACPELSFSYIVLSNPLLWYQGQEENWLYAAASPLRLRVISETGLQLKEKGHNYPGVIELKQISGALQIANEVSLEEFVAGSVAKEMSPSWPAEALKAQAIATRTVLVSRLGGATGDADYNLSDSELSYIGCDSGALGHVRQAVLATAGQLALYQGLPIQATYHADAGGYTQNSEDVWASALPYLRGVQELYASEGPDAHWTPSPSFSGAELQKLLREAGHDDIGVVRQVINEAPAASGVASVLRFVGSSGEITLKAPQVRTALQLKSNNFQVRPPQQVLVRSRFSLIVLPPQSYHIKGASGTTATDDLSNLMVCSAEGIERLPLGGGDKFVFVGSGWGHGVGLSQWGAKAMADRGYDYKAILMHYYTGITISVLAP